MRKAKYTEEQVAMALRQAEAGKSGIGCLVRQAGHTPDGSAMVDVFIANVVASFADPLEPLLTGKRGPR